MKNGVLNHLLIVAVMVLSCVPAYGGIRSEYLGSKNINGLDYEAVVGKKPEIRVVNYSNEKIVELNAGKFADENFIPDTYTTDSLTFVKLDSTGSVENKMNFFIGASDNGEYIANMIKVENERKIVLTKDNKIIWEDRLYGPESYCDSGWVFNDGKVIYIDENGSMYSMLADGQKKKILKKGIFSSAAVLLKKNGLACLFSERVEAGDGVDSSKMGAEEFIGYLEGRKSNQRLVFYGADGVKVWDKLFGADSATLSVAADNERILVLLRKEKRIVLINATDGKTIWDKVVQFSENGAEWFQGFDWSNKYIYLFNRKYATIVLFDVKNGERIKDISINELVDKEKGLLMAEIGKFSLNNYTIIKLKYGDGTYAQVAVDPSDSSLCKMENETNGLGGNFICGTDVFVGWDDNGKMNFYLLNRTE